MPAIQPARLKRDIAELTIQIGRPREFLLAFDAFLDFYADRIQRPGVANTSPSILPTVNLSPPALRQLIHELKQTARANPTEAFLLADALWREPFLEHRQVAAGILGSFSPLDQDKVLVRVQAWLEPGMDEVLLQAVLKEALNSLDKAGHEAILDLAGAWLREDHPAWKSLGLQTCRNLAIHPQFSNFPRLFTLITPVLDTMPTEVRGHLQDALESLARTQPAETAFFLQQAYIRTRHPALPVLIRQLLTAFPAEIAQPLRDLLKRK